MRVAFVTPRYGLSVYGGAESAARHLAERLARRAGWSVEVYTTCALDHRTWADVMPPGESLVNGVVVHRIPSYRGRDPNFDAEYARVAVHPAATPFEDALRWVELQGPLAPDLVEAVVAAPADMVAFYPYLYYPTVFAIGRVRVPAVLHPAAHDEPAFHLPVYRATFRSADALVYHTASERQLVERHHRVADRPQRVLGLGVDAPPAPHRPGGEVAGVGDRPYLASVGRVDPQKGSRLLVEYFRTFKERHGGDLALVMVGPVVEAVPEEPDVVVTGPVSDQDKWDILRGATVSVSASPYESFSLAVMEAAASSVPVVVNGVCGPTREFCEQSGGGTWFTSYGEFEVALERLLGDAGLRAALGAAGRAYVRRHYDWSVVIDRYASLLAKVGERPRVPTPWAELAS